MLSKIFWIEMKFWNQVRSAAEPSATAELSLEYDKSMGKTRGYVMQTSHGPIMVFFVVALALLCGCDQQRPLQAPRAGSGRYDCPVPKM